MPLSHCSGAPSLSAGSTARSPRSPDGWQPHQVQPPVGARLRRSRARRRIPPPPESRSTASPSDRGRPRACRSIGSRARSAPRRRRSAGSIVIQWNAGPSCLRTRPSVSTTQTPSPVSTKKIRPCAIDADAGAGMRRDGRVSEARRRQRRDRERGADPMRRLSRLRDHAAASASSCRSTERSFLLVT